MNLFAYDTETHLIRPGLLAPPLVCGSVAGVGDNEGELLDKDAARAWFREHIRTSRIVGTNLAYDLGVMAADNPALLPSIFEAADHGRLHDVSIRQALIDIANGTFGIDPRTGRQLDDDEGVRYSLALLTERHLGIDISDEKNNPDAWRLRYAELDGIPVSEWPEAAVSYPKRDAVYTRRVFEAQEGGPNLHDEARQVRAALALHLMAIWGIRTNGERVLALRERVEAEWERSREEFRRIGLFRADGSKDTKKLKAMVTAAYNGEPPYTPPSQRYPEGQIATDRDTLVQSGDPVLERLGRGGKNDKLKSTYLPKLEQGIYVPLNPRFNVLVATGRCSSDMQQLPQKGGVRECHEPRPGYVYCSVDYGGLELRTMSQRAIWELGWSSMADALNSGLDAHCIAAASMMGVTYEEAYRRYKIEKDPIATGFRALGKVFNFGKGGGMGAPALVYNARAKDDVSFCLMAHRAERCGAEKVKHKIRGKVKSLCAVCVLVGRELDAAWLNAWPEQQQLFRNASAMTANEQLVEAVVPVSNRVRAGCGYTQWLNTPFQGLGGDLAKDATWRVSREMYTDPSSPLWGSRLVLMVHDELIAEMPEDRAPEAADRMAQIMRETAIEWLPDLAPSIEAEPAISRILSKDMAMVRDESGRLQIWEPKNQGRK